MVCFQLCIGKPIIKLVNSSDDEPIVSDVISVVSNQIYNVTVEFMGLANGLVDDYVNVTIDGEAFGTCKISKSATSCAWNTCNELNKEEILTKSSKLFVKLHFNNTDRKQVYCNEPNQAGHGVARITLTPQGNTDHFILIQNKKNKINISNLIWQS